MTVIRGADVGETAMHAARQSLEKLRLVLSYPGQDVVGGLLGIVQAIQP